MLDGTSHTDTSGIMHADTPKHTHTQIAVYSSGLVKHASALMKTQLMESLQLTCVREYSRMYALYIHYRSYHPSHTY